MEHFENTNAHDSAPAAIACADDYWQLIGYLYKRHAEDTEAYFAEAEEILSAMSPESAARFAQYSGLYCWAADECIWLDMACKAINDYVSDDTALYFNLWVISRGKQVLLAAMKDPDSLSELSYLPFDEASFEMLMSLGGRSEDDLIASERQALLSEITYGNGGKLGGYASFELGMNDYKKFTSKLLARRETAHG